MEPRKRAAQPVDAANQKRIARKREAIKEILITECTHKDNLARMVAISRDPEFRKHFAENGLLLARLTEIADKTETMLAEIYRGTPWENMELEITRPNEKPQQQRARLGEGEPIKSLAETTYSPNSKMLRQLINTIPKLMVAQLECTALANAYNSNPVITKERLDQGKKEKEEREAAQHASQTHATHQTLTSEFTETKNPILLSQRFPRYELLLKELQKLAGDYPLLQKALSSAIEETHNLSMLADILTPHLDLLDANCRNTLLANLPHWNQKTTRANIQAVCEILKAVHDYQKSTKLPAHSVMMQALLKPVEAMITTKFSSAPISENAFQQRLQEAQSSLAIIAMIATNNPQDENIVLLERLARESLNALMRTEVASTLDQSNNAKHAPRLELSDILNMPLRDMMLGVAANQEIATDLQALLGNIDLRILNTSSDPNVKQLAAFLEFLAVCRQDLPDSKLPFLTAAPPFNTAQTLQELFSNALKGPTAKYEQDLAKPRRSLSDKLIEKKSTTGSAPSVAGLFANKGTKTHLKVQDALQKGAPAIYNALAKPTPPAKSRTF